MSGSADDGTPAAPTSRTDAFGSIVPSTESAFGGGTGFGALFANAISPPVTTGTSTPAYSVFFENDPSNPSTILQYICITATPAYKGSSLEELRVQDYQQICKPAGVSGKTSSGAPTQTSSPAKPMVDPGKLENIEELLRKLALGEELVNTQFHLFSARSLPSGQVMKPRVFCANNVLLAKSSKYFVDLLSSDINPSDASLVDLTGDNDIPSNARVEDYGYGSDSDLEECDDPIAVVNPEAPEDQSMALSTSPSEGSAEAQPKDNDGLSENGSGSVGSGVFVVYPEQPRTGQPFSANKDGARSVVISETAVSVGNMRLGNQMAMRLRSLESRHVLVKDTAFQTWYTLLNYLFTGKVSFLPLSSTTGGRHLESSTSSLDEPKCSAKSMYRLASKVGLDQLRDEAFSYIRNNLTEYNILKELSCSLVSRHPELLEMELDVLYSHIASPPVAANFAAFAQRIADKELPHGASIIFGIYARLLKERQPLMSKPGFPIPLSSFSGLPKPAELAVGASDAPEAGAKHETGPFHVGKRGARSDFLPSESGVAFPGAPLRTSVSMAATSTNEPDAGAKGNKEATGKYKRL